MKPRNCHYHPNEHKDTETDRPQRGRTETTFTARTLTQSIMCCFVVATLCLTGCKPPDLSAVATDASQLYTAFQQNKAIVEDLAADIKRDFAPDTPEYQRAMSTYYQAQKAESPVLDRISALAGSKTRSVAPDDSSVQEFEKATRAFGQAAEEALAPNDRGIVAMALLALPSIRFIAQHLPKNKTPLVTRAVETVRWRSWDALLPTDDTATDPSKTKSRRSNATAKAPKGVLQQ